MSEIRAAVEEGRLLAYAAEFYALQREGASSPPQVEDPA
jgi:queuine/archaeosine tRNA-ribosyltransferase